VNTSKTAGNKISCITLFHQISSLQQRVEGAVASITLQHVEGAVVHNGVSSTI